MPRTNHHTRALLLALCCLLTAAAFVRGQSQPPKPAPQEDVVRVDSELVQTEVMVFDKAGKFVDGLTREQFELRVDGKPVPVAFFDSVLTGTGRPRIPTTTGASPATAAPAATAAAAPLARGRTLVFFIDDLHLSLDSLGRTRSALTRFIEQEMGPRDRVMFVTASGQLGFLQQFTDHKGVLRAAVSRLRHIPSTVRDNMQPPLPEYHAIQIANGDKDVAGYYVEEILKGMVTKKERGPGTSPRGIMEMVKARAEHVVLGLEAVSDATLTALENTLRAAARAEGRKLVFFISDGFFLDTKKASGSANFSFQRVADLAARTGSVVYTIDARGLFSTQPDATGERPHDPKGRLDRASFNEAIASQDGLSALASDTGGDFLKNTNYFDRWVSQRLEETSRYYLLAWRPDAEEQKGGKFKRMEVKVAGRPDLTVRLQRGYLPPGAKAAPETKPAGDTVVGAATPDASKKTAAASAPALDVNPAGGLLPTLVSATYVDVPGTGPVLTSSVQVASAGLGYGADGKPAAVDVGGVVMNDQGKHAATFKTRLNVSPTATTSEAAGAAQGVIYNHRAPLAPGLYQVRVVARDERTGQVGSAAQWIEIPNLASKQLALSSLHLGGRAVGGATAAKDAASAPQIQFSVDHRFARSSKLDFLTVIYNAARNPAGQVDLSAQIQVLRDGRPVVSAPPSKLRPEANADLARVPFGGVISLGQLPPGPYDIEIIVTDNLTRTTTTQRASFEIQ